MAELDRSTLADIAQHAGVSRSTVYKVEAGDPGATLGSYFRVLEALGLGGDLDKLGAWMDAALAAGFTALGSWQLGRQDEKQAMLPAGTIAGSLVRSGLIRRNAKARVLRDGIVVGDNLTIESLKRFKEPFAWTSLPLEAGYQEIAVTNIRHSETQQAVQHRKSLIRNVSNRYHGS